MRYEVAGRLIGFNGPFLAELSEGDFIKEVKHHFKDDPKGKEKMKELRTIIRTKYKTKSQNAQTPSEGLV